MVVTLPLMARPNTGLDVFKLRINDSQQQPYGLLETAGHLVSMPRHNVNSEELS